MAQVTFFLVIIFSGIRANLRTVRPSVGLSVGQLARWSVGPLVRWSVGALVRWSVGPLVRLLIVQKVLGCFYAFLQVVIASPLLSY